MGHACDSSYTWVAQAPRHLLAQKTCCELWKCPTDLPMGTYGTFPGVALVPLSQMFWHCARQANPPTSFQLSFHLGGQPSPQVRLGLLGHWKRRMLGHDCSVQQTELPECRCTRSHSDTGPSLPLVIRSVGPHLGSRSKKRCSDTLVIVSFLSHPSHPLSLPWPPFLFFPAILSPFPLPFVYLPISCFLLLDFLSYDSAFMYFVHTHKKAQMVKITLITSYWIVDTQAFGLKASQLFVLDCTVH